MQLMRHILACNQHDPGRYRPFVVDGRTVGWITNNFAAALAGLGAPFAVLDGGIALTTAGDADARTQAVAQALSHLSDRVPSLRGEWYPVVQEWGDTPLLAIDRAAAACFGIRCFGVHVNGFVRRPDGLWLWVARRARDRAVAPGKLDNLVAGGQPLGLSLADNLRKEAAEEAGLPTDIADRAQPVGRLCYAMDHPLGLKRDTLFCYDLELYPDEQPCAQDGEVESFTLWSAAQVLDSIRHTEDWKFNVNLVVIDFLLRHGVIGRDDPEYSDLRTALNRKPIITNSQSSG